MDGSICLSFEQRKNLLKAYRSGNNARAARRAHIVLLLAEGWSYREVRGIAFCSYDLIVECAARFREKGSAGVLNLRDALQQTVPRWLTQVAHWLASHTPQDFGYYRRRWSCEALAEVLAWETGVRLSRETSGEVCGGLSTCGAGRGLWSDLKIRGALKNSAESSSCSSACQTMRRPCFRTKSTCISIPSWATAGWFADSRPKSSRQATTRSDMSQAPCTGERGRYWSPLLPSGATRNCS